MEDLLKEIQSTPIPIMLIVVGLLILVLAFVVKIGGIIEVSSEQRRFAIPTGLLVLAIGLLLNFATPNTETTKKAIYYIDSDFKGASMELFPAEYDVDKNSNDAISSLKVSEGIKVTLFEDSDFQGQSESFDAGDYNYVGDALNDKTSSIKVEKNNAQS